jgi:hypothetical protein
LAVKTIFTNGCQPYICENIYTATISVKDTCLH